MNYSFSAPMSLLGLRLMTLGCLVIAAAMAFLAAYDLTSANLMSKWPTVNGIVISSSVDSGKSGDIVYAPLIRYRYEVGNAAYVGDRFEPTIVHTGNRRAVAALVEQYPAGKNVTVYYDPHNPAAAILEPAGKSGVWLFLLLAAGFGGVGSIFFLFLFTSATDSFFRWLSQDAGRVFRVTVGCLAFAFIATGAGSAAASWYTWKRITESLQWPTANATVLTSRLATRTDSDNVRSYGPHVEFRYQVGGKTYEGDRLGWGGQTFTGNPRRAEAILKDYPVGRSVTVRYDPNDPAESVVNPSATGSFWFTMVFAIVFGAIGLVGLAVWLFVLPRIFGPAVKMRGKGAQ